MPAVPYFLPEYSSEFTPSHTMFVQETYRSCSSFLNLSDCLIRMCVVSQGVSCGLLEWQKTVVVSLAPRQIDRGDVGWPYWENTEAGKCRSWFWWKKETSVCSFS